jgi:hydrogenase maturation protease
MAWSSSPAPHQLLDDGFAPDPCQLLVIGCGNILRGDDAVGPVLIRTLFTRGVPHGVRLVDGGTAGMDVAFGMRGAQRVVIIDASATGAEPGTIYRVPAEELTELPPIDGLHTHNFRWDHALSFSAWLLGPLKPTDITVFLVEAAQLEPGTELSPPVAAGMATVMEIIEGEFYPHRDQVELTSTGYLHLPAALAAHHFPADVCVARMDQGDLVLMPLIGAANGGLVLKQRNLSGDRSLLVSEVLGFVSLAGTFEATWDAARGALLVLLSSGSVDREDTSRGDPSRTGEADRDRGPDRSGGRAGPVDGLSADSDTRWHRETTPPDLLHRDQGTTSGRRDPAYGGQAATTHVSLARERPNDA